MWIERTLASKLNEKLFSGKALLINGPRQVGKTSLIKKILESSNKEYQSLNADDPVIRELLDTPNTEQIRQILGENEILFIDEAQRVPNIGLTAKIITDEFPERQLILSGSSSFELSQQMQEPLTGRKWTYELFPISFQEWQDHIGYVKAQQDLPNRLVFGFYPDVLAHSQNPGEVLEEIVSSYLYKDVLQYGNLRKPELIQKLVQALAHQVGSEVVYRELAMLIDIDPKTIAQYIEVLEKAYVIFRLPSFSRNLRNEIKRNQKIYFYDNGVRNAVIAALQPLPMRQDIGALWENFLISERLKLLRYGKIPAQMYFWRTTRQQEIDYIEESNGKLAAFEFKWNPKKPIRIPVTFTSNYEAETKGVTQENFRDFILST